MTTLSRCERYLQKQRAFPPLLPVEVPADLALVVVVPCYNEPDLLTTLNSLWQAEHLPVSVEILVILNASVRADDDVLAQNAQTRTEVLAWNKEHHTPKWKVHLLEPPLFPHKQAGVGLARKTGMDEALHRFLQIGNTKGLLVNLDADCTVKPNYFRALYDAFVQQPEATGGHIYFEHPLDGLESWQKEAIVEYELFLRWYVQIFRYVGLGPYLHHTVGSTMLTRADAYAAIGGMNKRKAGEDFYFLQKLMAYGGFIEVNDTCVYPSARLSERVPFGTGRAIQVMQREQRGWPAYHPKSVEALALFVRGLRQQRHASPEQLAEWYQTLPEAIRSFLPQDALCSELQSIQKNTASDESYLRRCFQWFNLFQAMKYFHHARDQHFPNVSILDAVQWLSEHTAPPLSPPTDAESWLQELRLRDQSFKIHHSQK